LNAVLLRILPVEGAGDAGLLFLSGNYVNGRGIGGTFTYFFTNEPVEIQSTSFIKLPNALRVEASYLIPNKTYLYCPEGNCHAGSIELLAWSESVSRLGAVPYFGVGIGVTATTGLNLIVGPTVKFGLAYNI